MKNLKFAKKLLFVILGVSLASVVIISAIAYTELRSVSEYAREANVQLGDYASGSGEDSLVKQAEAYLSRLSVATAAVSDAYLWKIQSEVTVMAKSIGDIYKNQGEFGGDAEYVFARIHEGDGNLNTVYIGGTTGVNFRFSDGNSDAPDYDPRERLWYKAAIDETAPVWLDTYVNADGYVTTTCAMAYEDADGAAAGVVAADIHLSKMVEDLMAVRIGKTGFAFLVDGDGEYLAHSDFDVSDKATTEKRAEAHSDLLADMAAGQTGINRTNIGGTDFFLAYAPLPTTGWSLGLAVEYGEVVEDALMMKPDIDRQTAEVEERMRAALRGVMLQLAAVTGCIVIVVSALSILISNSVTKPLKKLTQGVIETGAGNLDKKVDIEGGDEIGALAGCFNKMTGDLKTYIDNLSKVTAEREHIAAELNVAAHIQASMLPHTFPPFPHITDVELFATMQPSKEVGGDFYDFFMPDDDDVFMVVADVSGKGVPAALFMVVAKTLIKNNAQPGLSPAEILAKTNAQLCEGNDAGMFVTAFIGRLTLPTGKLTFANAGHNPPAIKRGANWEYLKAKRGLVLALMESAMYEDNEIALNSGDALFLYTDGATEAMNRENKLYGETRLLETLDAIHEGASPAEIESAAKTDIAIFENGAEQADDITMLVSRYLGQ